MTMSGYPDSPLASGITGFSTGLIQGMQLAQQRKMLQQQVMEQKFETGMKKLQLAKELSAQYKDNPELHQTMVAPLWQQGMAGVTGDDKYLTMKYEYHPQDTKFFKHIAEAADAAYHSPEPAKMFDQLISQIMQRWEQATTPEDRAALKEAYGMLKEQKGEAAAKFGADYRELSGKQETDKAYQTPEATQGIEEYKKQYLMPTITSLDPKAGAELAKEHEKPAVAGIQEFETVTGIDKRLRGTPDYTKKYLQWKKDITENTIAMRIPSYQMVTDLPGMRFNRKTGVYENASLPEGQSAEGLSEKKAATKSLSNLRKQYDMTMQAENQAVRNINIAKDYSDKYVRTRYPLPNQFLAAMRTQTGDPKVEQFKLALLAASREYMRVVTGGARSSAELSIEAQKKADEILNTSKSWEVFKAQTDTMLQELGATRSSFEKQMQEQKDTISGKQPSVDKAENATKAKLKEMYGLK